MAAIDEIISEAQEIKTAEVPGSVTAQIVGSLLETFATLVKTKLASYDVSIYDVQQGLTGIGQSLSSETSARTQSDTAIQALITALTARVSALETSVAALQAALTAYKTEVNAEFDSVNSLIEQETFLRETEDEDIWTAIHALQGN